MRHVGVKEMRELDRRAAEEFGIPSLLLMENAGRSVADEVCKMNPKRAAVLFHKGKNGGDGLVAARHLHNRGVEVALYAAAPLSEFDQGSDTGINLAIVRKMGIPLEDSTHLSFSEAILIDAILGIGLGMDMEGHLRDIIEKVNQSDRPVVAIDVPSGLDADTGLPRPIAVRASRTITMGLPKIGFQNPAAAPYLGELVVADIGLPRRLLAGRRVPSLPLARRAGGGSRINKRAYP